MHIVKLIVSWSFLVAAVTLLILTPTTPILAVACALVSLASSAAPEA